MSLHSSQSAILSAIIYNALIIVALIPLALKGVKYREVSASKLLSRNLLVYGIGGIITPFICIKAVSYTHLDVYKRQFKSCLSLSI